MKLSEQIKISIRGIRYLSRLSRAFVLCKFGSAALDALTPYIAIYFSARLLDSLIAGNPVEVSAVYALLTVGLTFLTSVLCRWMTSVVDNRACNTLYCAEDWMYCQKAMTLAYESIEDRETTLLLNQIQMESQTGFNLYYLIHHSNQIVANLARIIASLGMTLSFFTLRAVSLESKLALIGGGVLLTLCGALATAKSAAIESAYFTDCVETNTVDQKLNSYIKDYASGKDIRLYGMADLLTEKIMTLLRKALPQMLYLNIKLALLALPSTILTDVLKYGAYLILIAACTVGAVSVGSIAKYVSCLMLLISAVSGLTYSVQMMSVNSRYLKRYFSYFDIPNNMYQGSLTVEKRDDNEYYVEFRDVSFRYPHTEEYALRHVNLKFKVGEKLAVVGRNGSGKTTFIKLLCRLYDPTEGQILLNGVDIRKYDYDEYISIFSVVFQDFSLLAMTLGQNVAAARDYEPSRVRECLSKAGFEARQESFPGGLETYLYKNYSREGIEISGGEAQKIALARALYKDAPFIVLDEPTAALDPVSEYEVYSKFNEIAGDKTAIYISHRLASCRFCDKIAVFDSGQIVQSGSHEKLLGETDGRYCELWNAQAQYYTD